MKKNIVDGYLDDNCKIAYYHCNGFWTYWYAISLSCGFAICFKKKRYECIEKAQKKLRNADLIEKRRSFNTLFERAEMANDDEKIECHNHWTEADNYIDLTTKEGLKILQSIKSRKRKKQAL